LTLTAVPLAGGQQRHSGGESMTDMPTPAPQPRRFGRVARLAAEQVQRDAGIQSNQTFQPLPAPTGAYPYRMDLSAVLGQSAVDAITQSGQLLFHCAGDTGGVKQPQPQTIVAMTMEQDLQNGPAPSFFYHLGDVVYYYGQKSEYYPQFYEPYANYPLPIMGIPGNHDGDPLDPTTEPSLAGFVENFCAPRPILMPEAQETHRDAMTQPNVYWTLHAPFLTVIGLYSNVPEGGRVDNDQVSWFHAELAAAPPGAVIMAVHHPPYSADAHHGGSAAMGALIDAAVAASGRVPDAVLTAHVHNYQRFTRTMQGRQVPYIVAGAGGYWHLHPMAPATAGGAAPEPGWRVPLPNDAVTLEHSVADRHGFLRLTVSPTAVEGRYITVPRPHESWTRGPVTVADAFRVDLDAHTVTTEQPSGARPA
jgi:3',5'-cyclic AMP phosphodiesterase CpdA